MIAMIISLAIGQAIFAFKMYLLESEKSQQLKQHIAKLDFWVNQGRTAFKGKDKLPMILGICKMPEKEIFDKLINIFIEETIYFIETKGKDNDRNEFYRIVITTLGYMENPRAGKHIVNTLENLSENVLDILKEEKQEYISRLFSDLFSALVNSKSKNTSVIAEKISVKVCNTIKEIGSKVIITNCVEALKLRDK